VISPFLCHGFSTGGNTEGVNEGRINQNSTNWFERFPTNATRKASIVPIGLAPLFGYRPQFTALNKRTGRAPSKVC
jgi:hypothetical protein